MHLVGPMIFMTKDHIVPSSIGGSDDLSNLQTMCEDCNSIKSNLLIDLDELKELVCGKHRLDKIVTRGTLRKESFQW